MIDYSALIWYIENLDGEKAIGLIEEFITLNPTKQEGLEVLKTCQIGTEKVGHHYEKGEYFISDLLVAGALLEEIKGKLKIIIGDEIHWFKTGRIKLTSDFGDESEQGEIVLARIIQRAGFIIINAEPKVS